MLSSRAISLSLLAIIVGQSKETWPMVQPKPAASSISSKVAPRYIMRDRAAVYGDVFIRRLRAMSIRDRPTAPRSPWQNGYCERAIGAIRRARLDQEGGFGD